MCLALKGSLKAKAAQNVEKAGEPVTSLAQKVLSICVISTGRRNLLLASPLPFVRGKARRNDKWRKWHITQTSNEGRYSRRKWNPGDIYIATLYPPCRDTTPR
jgi:hypothetical protein